MNAETISALRKSPSKSSSVTVESFDKLGGRHRPREAGVRRGSATTP